MKRLIAIPILLLATGCSGFDVTFDPQTGRPVSMSIRGKAYSVATPTSEPLPAGASTVAVPSSGDTQFDNLLARTASAAARGDYDGARLGGIDISDYAAARGHDARSDGRGATGASATAGAAPDPKAAAREATKQNARDALKKIGEDF